MVNLPDKIKELYPFKNHFLRLKNGYNYHYVDEGSGEAIVMVHGNPSWSFLFRNLIKELREKYRIIAPDHLGFGLSDKPEDYPYRLEAHIDNFEELINSLKLDQITLLMHDWGGPIAMGFAERNPEKIKRIIITNTAVFTVDKMPFRLKLCRIPFIGGYMVKKLNLFAKFATTMTTVKPLAPSIRTAYLFPFREPGSRTAIHKFVEDIPMWPEHSSYELLVQLEHGLWFFREKPICIIWGLKDWCFTEYFFRRWREYYPEAEAYALQDAAHFLFEDNPQRVLSLVSNFLQRN